MRTLFWQYHLVLHRLFQVESLSESATGGELIMKSFLLSHYSSLSVNTTTERACKVHVFSLLTLGRLEAGRNWRAGLVNVAAKMCALVSCNCLCPLHILMDSFGSENTNNETKRGFDYTLQTFFLQCIYSRWHIFSSNIFHLFKEYNPKTVFTPPPFI